jgi:hypothetical protein
MAVPDAVQPRPRLRDHHIAAGQSKDSKTHLAMAIRSAAGPTRSMLLSVSTIRTWLALPFLVATLAGGAGALAQHGSQAIHEDYVPDGKTAVAIAEAMSRGQLGDVQLSQILPFEAHLDGEVWHVTSRIGLGRDAEGKGALKGVTMDIRRDTGEIVFFGYYPID